VETGSPRGDSPCGDWLTSWRFTSPRGSSPHTQEPCSAACLYHSLVCSESEPHPPKSWCLPPNSLAVLKKLPEVRPKMSLMRYFIGERNITPEFYSFLLTVGSWKHAVGNWKCAVDNWKRLWSCSARVTGSHQTAIGIATKIFLIWHSM